MSNDGVDMEAVNAYVRGLELESQEMKNQNRANAQAAMGQMQQQEEQQNLVRWQLDFTEDLERIYHLLKGHVIVVGADNELEYQEPKDESMKPFNDKGVQLLMNILRFYLNRNTILSNYDEDTILWKVKDFGNAVRKLIYMKYLEMGMDTPEKRKMYPMIVQELTDTVHSAYLRALYGGERNSLRQIMTVNQTQPLGVPFMNPNKKNWSLLKPSTWGG